MKTIKNILWMLSFFLLLTGCKDSFFDVNTPSNVLDESQISYKMELPYIESHIASMQYSIVRYMDGLYDQQLASASIGGADTHDRTSLGGAWSTYYSRILPNVKIMKKLAQEDNNSHYLGIAQILEALATQMATDQWGDIPYSEAGMGSQNLTPNLDSQEDIYNSLLNLLNNAITNLQASANGEEPGADDLFYGGDLNKWIKAAYTLKARLNIHLTKRNGTTAAQDAIDALQNGFTSTSDDMQIIYDAVAKNPWYSNVVAANQTGNLSVLWSEQLIDQMNGTDYPYTNITYDPRLPHYADNHGNATYVGSDNGAGGNGNCDLANDGYFTEDAPVFLLTYMEAEFIKSEAEFILGHKQNAYNAYIAGITASMDKVGIPTSDRDDYLNENSIGFWGDFNQLEMKHILKEKNIALVVHPEPYTDMRRYNFDPAIFIDLDFPQNRSLDIPAGEWPRRAIYPNSEVKRNPNIEQITEYWSPVWWDQ